MAQPFYDKLVWSTRRNFPDDPRLKCKHFFSGAALYVNGAICVSLTPVGLAFKLSDDLCSALIDSGAATPLRYFANAPVKKGYVLIANPDALGDDRKMKYFIEAIAHVSETNI